MDHIAIIAEKGRTVTPTCSCGWHGPKATYGNAAGYSYSVAYAGEEWWRHATEHGFTDSKDKIRDPSGKLIATMVGRHHYRLSRSRLVRVARYASREFAIASAVSGWEPWRSYSPGCDRGGI
jgi:hypothetical protein